ncbi:MAG TPA: hypothetical protein DIT35_01630 [Rhodospirillaceae bacterium]|nr:hypothetical protein [Rhodospirillaceae bacterium]
MYEFRTLQRHRVARHRRLFALAALFAIAAALLPARVGAHPHVWIKLETKPVIDPAGRVEGLEIYWLFDSFYTVFAVEEMLTSDGSVDDAKLLALGRSNLENLRPFNYFTNLHLNGAEIEIANVEWFETGLKEGRLWMRFVVPLATPVNPRVGIFSYAVFDPSYYIDIAYAESNHARLDEANATDCQTDVEEAAPTFEAISLAKSIDLGTTSSETLGEMFAQRVRLKCT